LTQPKDVATSDSQQNCATEITVSSSKNQHLVSPPVELTGKGNVCRLQIRTLLIPPKLLFGKRSTIGFLVMLKTKGDDSFRILVVFLRPWRIKMMPTQVGAPATGHRTSTADLVPE
jgi:hypothetical protein